MKLFIILTLLFHTICSQKSCTEIPGEDECDNESGNACKWYSSFDECRCISTVKLDILFAVDTSGSIGWEGFQIQKQFIETLVNQGVNNGSRIGFYMFDTTVNKSKAIQYWDAQELADYSAGLHWHRGWTNTGQVLSDSINQFKEAKATAVGDRQQILIMITDGNPCLPVEQGGCPQNICEMEMLVKNEGIRTIIIGVGDGLNTEYVDCLVEKPEDFIPVASFSTEDFNSIMGSLSGVLCPISKSCKFTEIKAMRRPAGWNENGDGRFTRFVEIYNTGVDFNAQELKLEGLVTMASGPDILVPQGSYLVFYDAADGPVSTDASSGPGPSIPSCHDCGSDCGLTTCLNHGQGPGTTDHCFCDNSIYIACTNPQDSCVIPGSLVDDSSANNAENGCSLCSFNNNMDKTNWNIAVKDSNSDNLIDEVIYGDQGYWITTTDKFSYELYFNTLPNDIGDNWGQSCSTFGTPGALPYADCDVGCIINTCGGNQTCQSNGNCFCDPTKGYYGSCTTKKNGGGLLCTKCLLVPPIDDCEVHWFKNGTFRNAAFNWTKAAFSGSAAGAYYKVTYFDSTGQESIADKDEKGNPLTTRRWNAKANYDASNTSFGGWVQACVLNEIPLDGGGKIDLPACGTKTWCEVYTARPTQSPTPSPTPQPTTDPTREPTPAPTWACPQYWLTGGTSQAICAPVVGAGVNDYQGGDRCTCHGTTREQCCLLDPDFSTTYDAERQHKTDFGCKMDVELLRWKQRPNENAAGISPGYLLTAQSQPHNFKVDIAPENYPCTMDIYWRLKFDCVSEYDGRRRLQACQADAGLRDAGLEIDVTGGWLKVWGQTDVTNTSIQFTVSQAECSEDIDTDDNEDDQGEDNDDQGEDNDNNGNGKGGSKQKKCDLFDGVAIYGVLEIVNATSQCQPNCEDLRLYPMRIPVWYNYGAAFVAPPTQEKELPAWLWWLVAALVVFLALLAFLLYRYWWKNKKTGAALGSVQADLDAAVMEQEMGFGAGLGGNAVGFNPLATGFNPNAPAGGVAPNGPPGGNAGGGDFIKPNVEKPVFKQHYGPQMGNSGHLR